MSITYTPSTNFGAKDSLPSNDSNKVIRGSEFTTEFTAIQTAFGLAAPAASPTFTGTVTIASVDINGGNIDGTTIGGTTPAAGTFSSLTATTADINGGTIDGVTIGGASAGAITGTTGQFNTSLNVDGTVTADGLTVGIGDYLVLDGGSTGEVIRTPVAGTLTLESRGSVDIYGDSNNNGTSTSDVFRVLRDSTYAGGTAKVSLKVDDSGDISFYEDTGTTPKFFWDASAEFLGVGTVTPSQTIEARSATQAVIRVRSDAGSITDFGSDATGTYWKNFTAASNTYRWLQDDGTENMRLDASGNLLVGKTDTTGNVAGVSLRSTGLIVGTVSGGTVGYFNRTTSDGTLLDFRKDNTTVGSIASRAGVVTSFILNPSVSVGAGITEANTGGGPSISPIDGTGATADASIDLGTSSIRWQDLYLSGGVYLGGTGAANLLDDYEEGTFTPADNNIGAYTNSYGRYTKVGNLVHCFGYFTVQSNSNSNGADLTMPFTYGFSAQTATIGTVLTNEAGSYYLKSTSNTLLTIVDEDEVVQTLADFSTKTVHFNVTFHVA